jgi:hypothetical protein
MAAIAVQGVREFLQGFGHPDAAKLRERDGIAQASCLMATPANLAQLQDADLSIDTQAARPRLVVVRGEPGACDEPSRLRCDPAIRWLRG